MTIKNKLSNSGQAMMVLVMVLAIVILYVSEVFVTTTSNTSQTFESSEEIILQEIAEGSLENAAIRFLRSTSYAGESLNENGISCTIVVSGLGGGVSDLSSSCERTGRSVVVGMTASDTGGSYTFSKIAKR